LDRGRRSRRDDPVVELEDEHRDALRLRVIEDRPYGDVARELGISEQAASGP
jgi:DNA-directed RNA polymerase specialized sigma24 family protein